jgi:mono/diheme cytochrome c family protein
MKKRVKNLAALVIVFGLSIGSASSLLTAQDGTWVAPASADQINNPFAGNTDAIKAGKKLYNQNCSICHGAKGRGDGMAGMALKPRPADFTKDIVKNQTDGAIFWKITEGKAPMAAYKTTFSEEQRWQLVNYLRELE